MWRVGLLDGETWDMRFRLLGVELMQEPLLVLVTIKLLLLMWTPRFSSSTALFDRLFTRRTGGAIMTDSRHRPLSVLSSEETTAFGSFVEEPDTEHSNTGDEGFEEEEEVKESDSGLTDDLPSLFVRASHVGEVASPLAFFQAQEMV